MATCFKFLKSVSLHEIDKEICEYSGREVGKEYSDDYYFVTLSGISILNDGDVITEEAIDKFCDRVHGGQFKELLKEFLIRRYSFKAWWEGKS